MSKPIAIYTSYNIRYPASGHVLAELHYMVGLRRLGYQVVVVEESGQDWAPCFNPVKNEMTKDPTYGIERLLDVLRRYGLEECWCYVDSDRKYHGMTATELHRLCRGSTVLFSRANVNWLDEFTECRTRVFVDTDPGFTQFRLSKDQTPSQSGYASPFDFQFQFTCGERLGKPDCTVPLHGIHWRPTRHPVALELVPCRFNPNAAMFSTIMSWSSRAPIIFNGEEYGQKNVEFLKILNLPKQIGSMFEIGLAGAKAPRTEIEAAGWKIVDPRVPTATIESYLDYIAASRGEFSVAVNLSVKARTGVITDRAITYLAAGKPVILQETGFSEILPTGEGLLAFRDEAEAAAAVETVNRDYEKHCRAARRLAEDWFDSDKVLGDLLRQCDLPVGS